MKCNIRFAALVATAFQAVGAIAIPFESPPEFRPEDRDLVSTDHLFSALEGRALPEGTCNANTPCVNSACCGTNGLCGYSPTECGKGKCSGIFFPAVLSSPLRQTLMTFAGNCTSNCDAKAQCGQYGKPGNQDCPLNVCCSEFGWVKVSLLAVTSGDEYRSDRLFSSL